MAQDGKGGAVLPATTAVPATTAATGPKPPTAIRGGDDRVLCLPDRVASTRWVLTFPYPSPHTWLTLRRHGARYVGSAHAMAGSGDGTLRCVAYVETEWLRGDQLDGWFQGAGRRLVTIRRATSRTAAIPYARGEARSDDVAGPWANDPALLLPAPLLRDEPAPPVPAALSGPAGTGKRGDVESRGWLITISASALADDRHAAGPMSGTVPALPMPGLGGDGDIAGVLGSIPGTTIDSHRFTMLHDDPTYEYRMTSGRTHNARYIIDRLRKGLATLPGVAITDALRLTPTD